MYSLEGKIQQIFQKTKSWRVYGNIEGCSLEINPEGLEWLEIKLEVSLHEGGGKWIT